MHTLRWLARSPWKCRSVLGTTPRCRPLDQSVTDRRSVRATGSKAVRWSRNRDAACHASKRRGRSRRRDRGSHSCGTRPWPGRAVCCTAARTFSGHGYSSCSRGCHGGGPSLCQRRLSWDTRIFAHVQNSEPARQVIGMLEGKHQSSMGVLWSRSFRGPLPAP